MIGKEKTEATETRARKSASRTKSTKDNCCLEACLVRWCKKALADDNIQKAIRARSVKVWKRVGHETSDFRGSFHFPLPTVCPAPWGACALHPYMNATAHTEWNLMYRSCHNVANVLLQKTRAMLLRDLPHKQGLVWLNHALGKLRVSL